MHYFGQWLYLTADRVPVTEFSFGVATVSVNYQVGASQLTSGLALPSRAHAVRPVLPPVVANLPPRTFPSSLLAAL